MIKIKNKYLILLICIFKKNNKICKLGIGDWGLGIGPNPQSPIPNPQSPIKNIFEIYYKLK